MITISQNFWPVRMSLWVYKLWILTHWWPFLPSFGCLLGGLGWTASGSIYFLSGNFRAIFFGYFLMSSLAILVTFGYFLPHILPLLAVSGSFGHFWPFLVIFHCVWLPLTAFVIFCDISLILGISEAILWSIFQFPSVASISGWVFPVSTGFFATTYNWDNCK